MSENSGHIEERRVKPNYAQHCVLQCTDERLSGRTCNFYIVLIQKVGEPAICKYGYLPGIDYFIFLKKEKSSTSTAKVRVLVGQNFGKIKMLYQLIVLYYENIYACSIIWVQI